MNDTMTVDTMVASFLRAHREAAGLSQPAVARKCGIHVQTYYRWEKGTLPPIRQFRPLCFALKLNQAGAEELRRLWVPTSGELKERNAALASADFREPTVEEVYGKLGKDGYDEL